MKDNDFKDLLLSIDQMRDIHEGKIKPKRVFKFEPIEVKNIRKKFNLSQTEFSYMIGVNLRTLQNWEQGRRKPDGPALALLKVAEANPKIVFQALYF